MENVVCFKAYDGTIFTNKEECIEYEKNFSHEYEIILYATGSYCTRVRAKSKDEAIKIAKYHCFSEEIDWDFNDEETEVNLIEGD